MCICVNRETESTAFLEQAIPSRRPLPLPVDPQEISGGFEGIQKKIQVGDLVRPDTTSRQQEKEKSENAASSLTYIDAAITLKGDKEINQYLAAGWKLAHIFRGDGRMILVRTAE